jgi:hypothetical protein
MTLLAEQVLGWAVLLTDQLRPPEPYSIWVEPCGDGEASVTLPHGGAYSSFLSITLDSDRENDPQPSAAGDSFVILLDISGDRAGVIFDNPNESVPQAIVRLADQLQDHVMETSGGRPVPACPRHQHPATAAVIKGVPVWRCPNNAEHYTHPILG